jgi:hypothetical protein
MQDHKKVIDHGYQGRLHPLIDRTFLTAGWAAPHCMEQGDFFGKLVLQP